MVTGFGSEILLSSGMLLFVLLKPFGLKTSRHARFYIMVLLGMCALTLYLAPAGTVLPAKAQKFFILDPWSRMVKWAILLMTAVTVCFLNDVLERLRQLSYIEIYALLMLQTLGMFLVIMSINWISLLVSLELMYLPMYALVALKADDRSAQEAACKYILMGALSTGILLYGISLIYAVTGEFSFSSWHALTHDGWVHKQGMGGTPWLVFSQAQAMMTGGALLVTVGLLFKMGVVPFHWWVRDVYEGSTYPVVALIGGVPKVVIALVWVRIFIGEGNVLPESWTWVVLIAGIGSMYFGHVMALVQDRIRALLAYSSLAHMGFVMLALQLASQAGNQAAILYTWGYGFTVVSVFVVLGAMQVDGRDVMLVEDLKGLAQKQPRVALFLLCALFSLLGMPPFLGFFLKVQVLSALLKAEYYILAAVSLVPMVIAAGYYLQVVSAMYFHAYDSERSLIFVGGRGQQYYLLLAAVALLVLGMFPGWFFSLPFN